MSGHSKWTQIKRQKGMADQKRGALFTKLGNAITLASREKGGNSDNNFSLRLAIEKAKAANMPKDNIERAIKRGLGELTGGQIEEALYEGFGSGQVAIIIKTLSDNKNRTVSNLKHILSKFGGSLAGTNSVRWMFKQKGIIRIEKQELRIKKNEAELKIIEAGAEDMEEDEDEFIIYSKPSDLQKVKEKLESMEIPVAYAEIEWVAKDKMKVDAAGQEKLAKLFAELDDNEDINSFYTNLNS